MNTNQVKCFLTLADTLNFTKAARKLFISQPGLSKQIVSLETELKTILFIRDKQKVRLTPAGALLAEELSSLSQNLNNIIDKVVKIGEGYSGQLTIGILSGQRMGNDLTDDFIKFMRENPYIDLAINQGSFHDLREWLSSGAIDIAITLRFDTVNMDDIIIEPLDEDIGLLAVSKYYKFIEQEIKTISDIKEEKFIVISAADSPIASEIITELLCSNGVNPRNIKYAPNLATATMWIEAGMGIGIINHRSILSYNPSIRILDIKLNNNMADNCAVWNKKNLNPAISIFLNNYIQKNK